MNRFLLAALLSVALPAAALAQPEHHDDHPQGAPHAEHHDGGQPGGGHGPAATPAPAPGGAHAPGGGNFHGQAATPAVQPAPTHNAAPAGGTYRPQQYTPGPGGYRQNTGPGGYHQGPSNNGYHPGPGGRPGGQFSYHGQYRPAVRGGSFRYPEGYGYRRWGIGMSLPFLFLTSTYYFNDYATYGFGPPPPGCRWVRYGPDLLLVNRHTGRVVDVVYGVFY